MKKNAYILLAFSLLFSNIVFAQQNLTLYNMEVVPQRMYANPAFFPTYSKVNIGLPMISSGYYNISNSGFKYSDLVKHYKNNPQYKDSLYVDYDNMLSKLKPNNYLTTSIQPDLLSFGFAVKKNYFSFNITEKINLRFRYPKGFMEFLGKGNGGMLGQEVAFNFGVDFIHYREYGLGYSRKINDKLTIGGKLKYLYGMESVWSEKTDVSLTTDPVDFALEAKANIKVNTSIDTTFGKDSFSATNYAFKKKNRGAGIDLGGVYKPNSKFTFTASLIDLGVIKWKESVTTYQSKDPNASFVFRGVDINVLNSTDSTGSPLTSMLDSINKTFKLEKAHTAYKTRLSTQIYAGTNYNFTDKANAGILFYGQFFDKKIHPALSFSFNQRLGRWFNYSLSYSMYNRSYNNVGFGFGLNMGITQWYVLSDNLLGAIFPQNSKNIHLHTGLNITLGRIKKDKDKDGIADDKDICPSVPGILEFNGCPDMDKDHVADKDDLCPTDSGVVALKGCPDRDGDLVSDKTDSCPDIIGLAKFNGCPDKDGDNIMDKDDLCPADSGSVELKGCPDKDGDKIIDKEDACPDKVGPASNKGCPEMKLNLIDSVGVILKSATIGPDGKFTFVDSLPAVKTVRFNLEGEKTEKMDTVQVSIAGIAKTAARDSIDNYYHLVTPKVLVLDTVKMAAPEVKVVLDQQEAEVLKKAFNNLEFAAAKEIIKDESLASLDELAALMAKKPSWRLKISGHTDGQGNPGTNLKLSQKRAEAIKIYLVKKGIADNRFKVEWYGASKPIADNKTVEGRQKNRRVEMVIIE